MANTDKELCKPEYKETTAYKLFNKLLEVVNSDLKVNTKEDRLKSQKYLMELFSSCLRVVHNPGSTSLPNLPD